MKSKTPAQTTTKSAAAAQPASPHAVGAHHAKLVLERTFEATPEKLYRHWTDPKLYAKWMNPHAAQLRITKFDVRVGGEVAFIMPLDDGQEMPNGGVFHELVPGRRIVTGNPDKQFLIEVDFTPVTTSPARTSMKITVTGVPESFHPQAREGWGKGLDKLQNLVRGLPPMPHAAAPGAEGHLVGGVLHIERWFRAPPAKVFAAWSDPKLLPNFFWPVGTGKVEKLDFRPGGQLVMGHTTEPSWTATWTYHEIVPNQRIVTSDPFPGSDVVGKGVMEFIPENGGTRLKVTYGPFPPGWADGAAAGFGMVMDRLAEETDTLGKGDGFQLVRHFKASPQKVWEMWTTKEGLAKWWGPSANAMGYEFKVNALDVRVGGEYDIVMSNKEQGELHNHGKYVEVVPGRRLGQTWQFDIFLAPGEKAYPISITIDFEEVAIDPTTKGTKMTFTQGPMATAEFSEGSRQGVIQNLAHLAKALGE